MKKNLIIGIGNLILGDDAAGPMAARGLKKKLAHLSDYFDFKEYYNFSLDLLDEIEGYEKVMIIDSFDNGGMKSGECVKFSLDDLDGHAHGRFLNAHGMNLPTLWKFGRRMGLSMPSECLIFGISGKNFDFFHEKLSDDITAAFDAILDRLRDEATSWTSVDRPVITGDLHA